MVTALFVRKKDNIEGWFHLFDDEGKKIITALARSGKYGYEPTSWHRGKSPVPYTNDAYIWCNRVLQEGQHDPKGAEIGEAWHISNHPHDHVRFSGPSGKYRTYIMIHPENDYKGSAGCIVIVDDAAWKTISKELKKVKKRKQKCIKLSIREVY